MAAACSKVELRAAVIAEARAWIGTPYVHQQSAKGAGCDCLGLLRGVWRAVVGPEPIQAPAYTRDWAEAQGRETLLEVCRQFLHEIPICIAGDSDVIVFRMVTGARAKHCGILTGPDLLCHAYDGHQVIEESFTGFLRARRTARVAGAFAFPGA
jgi:NlpC/P60 family putative phage cell wall peptidase